MTKQRKIWLMATSETIQVMGEGVAQQGVEVDDKTTKVSSGSSNPYERVGKYSKDMDKLNTYYKGINLTYLCKFVLPYDDCVEKMTVWTSKDINLL